MQAYVHKDGKTLGPYTVRELKTRVDGGILLAEDQASYDGQNWVKISHWVMFLYHVLKISVKNALRLSRAIVITGKVKKVVKAFVNAPNTTDLDP